MSLLKLWFIHNPVLVSYSICMRQGSSDLSGSQSALTCLCVCARAQLGLREFNKIEVHKRMYGLPQSGILINQLIYRRLALHIYHQTKFTPGMVPRQPHHSIHPFCG
jgi:hypothetical protein